MSKKPVGGEQVNFSSQSQEAIARAQRVAITEIRVGADKWVAFQPQPCEGTVRNPNIDGVLFFHGFIQEDIGSPSLRRLLGNIADISKTTTYAHSRAENSKAEAEAAYTFIKVKGMRNVRLFSYSSGDGSLIETIKRVNAANKECPNDLIQIDGAVFLDPAGFARETQPLIEYIVNYVREVRNMPPYPPNFTQETIAAEAKQSKQDMEGFLLAIAKQFLHPKRLATQIQEGRAYKAFEKREQIPPVIMVVGGVEKVASPTFIIPLVNEQGAPISFTDEKGKIISYIQDTRPEGEKGLHHRETVHQREAFLRNKFPNPATPIRVMVAKKGGNHSLPWSFRMREVLEASTYLLERLKREH